MAFNFTHQRHDASRGTALVVDDEPASRLHLSILLQNAGFHVIEAQGGREAVQIQAQEQIDIIFMDVMMDDMDGITATTIIKNNCNDVFIPVIFLTAMSDSHDIARCIDAGGDDVLTKPYDAHILAAKIIAQERVRDLYRDIRMLHGALNTEHEMAHHLHDYYFNHRNATVSEINKTIKSTSRFSGDELFTAFTPNHELYVMLCDFTGHGLPAALAAMPVSDIFHGRVRSGYSAQFILNECNRQLCEMLPPNIFMAVQLAVFTPGKNTVAIYNCGMPTITVIEGTSNRIRCQVPSLAPPLGVDDRLVLPLPQDVTVAEGDHILMVSDGVTEASDKYRVLFSDTQFLNAIQNTEAGKSPYEEILHNFSQAVRGHELADDYSLVDIHFVPALFPDWRLNSRQETPAVQPGDTSYNLNHKEPDLSIILSGKQLLHSDPVPLLFNNIDTLTQPGDKKDIIYLVIRELLTNAIDHGALELDSVLKDQPDGFEHYLATRANRLRETPDAYVKIQFRFFMLNNRNGIMITIQDSGKGFDYQSFLSSKKNISAAHGRGLRMVRELCDTLDFKNNGSCVEATITWP